MTLKAMNIDGLLTNHPAAHGSLMEDDSERDEREDDWSKWRFVDGFADPVPPGTIAGERRATGPREPAIVWTGERWIDSEKGDLAEEETALMDAVAAQCPGGLAGWS